MKIKYTVGFLILVSLLSCTEKIYLHRIETFFNAATPETKARYMADDYRSYFSEKKGEGKDKAFAIQSFLK